MKSSIIITTSPQITTLTTFFIELAKTFYVNNYKVIVIFDKQKVRNDDSCGLIYKTWPNYRPTKWQDFLFLKRIVKEHKPEYIISSFGAVNIATIGGYLYGINNRVAWVHTKHKQLKIDTINNKLKDAFLHFRKLVVLRFFATEIHTNSKSTSIDITKHFKINQQKIKILYFLIKSNKSKYNVKEQIITSVGRFHPSKGQEVLIHAIPEVVKKFPEYKFYFIGGGKTLEEQKQTAKKTGVLKNCFFTGNLPQEEVFKLVEKSKIHISTSKDEAFGLVNLEAISLGTPILAHKVGGIQEILEPNKNGYFYNFEDSNDLAKKIIKILNDLNLQKSLQLGALQTFEERFLLNKKNLQNIVNQILNKS